MHEIKTITYRLKKNAIRLRAAITDVIKRPNHHSSNTTPISMTTPLLEAEERVHFFIHPAWIMVMWLRYPQNQH